MLENWLGIGQWVMMTNYIMHNFAHSFIFITIIFCLIQYFNNLEDNMSIYIRGLIKIFLSDVLYLHHTDY